MKRVAIILSSWSLTWGLLVALLIIVGTQIKITRDWRASLADDEKVYAADEQAKAIANAIEQYCFDFPDAGKLENNRQWTDRLAGQNPKGIRYINVKRFSLDSAGRLLDPCGSPWVVATRDSPEFQKTVIPQSQDEFEIRSVKCPGAAFGHPSHPRFPRSLTR
jgi:hypothetical protein